MMSEMEIKKIPIDEIGLSVRSLNALHRADVCTVGDMLDYTEAKLLQVRNLGQKSVREILNKIAEYTVLLDSGEMPQERENTESHIAIDSEKWIQENRRKVLLYLREKAVEIDALELLHTKAYNLLVLNGLEKLYQIIFRSDEQLLGIPKMDMQSASEIKKLCERYLREHAKEIRDAICSEEDQTTPFEMLQRPEYRDAILAYVKANDLEVVHMMLPQRAKNQLNRNGYIFMSDILFLTPEQIKDLPAMGVASAEAVANEIHAYWTAHEAKLMAVCNGDTAILFDDAFIRKKILQLYKEHCFAGFSLTEMQEKLPKEISLDRMKKVIGSLLAERELEYVDFRCYRIYGKFQDYLEMCPSLGERSRECIRKRLSGFTLEAIGQEYGIEKERVRQIVKKDVHKVRDFYIAQTGKEAFDEDYFRYLYETYAFDKKDGARWLGIAPYVWNYLDLLNVKQGKAEFKAALEDLNLDMGMRLKIKTYLNRDKVYVDGRWVEKKRAELEQIAVQKLCQEDVPFSRFVALYNAFLEQEEIAYDPELYYTDSVIYSRKNRLGDRRYLLWKQNKTIRYYDIDSRDYTELLDTLNLELYENIELSTAKFMRDYPEIMKKYDIRDQYELHNLLRKIVPEGSLHGFHCGKMPTVSFGTFDRNSAILDMIISNAPISQPGLCALIEEEYGYESGTIVANYLPPFSAYYHQGMYTVEQKVMSLENSRILKAALTDDFYYMDEIKRIYTRLIPGVDAEEINPYNLKTMGFIVLSRYVVQHYPSLEAYCEDILTREEIVDVTPYRKKLTYVQMFSQKLSELKRNLTVIEFEPNKLIQFKKLQSVGVTKETVKSFCSAVYDFVEDGAYFSIQSVTQDAFTSELYDLGFSDLFYANLLLSDDRFSSAKMFGTLILCKNGENITIQSFLMDRIREHGIIDVYDLMTELSDRYGCQVEERTDILYKVQNTQVYYDSILDRLYVNADAYYRDLEEGGY